MKSPDDPIFALLERELRSLQPIPPDPDFLGKLERKMDVSYAAAPAGDNVVAMPTDNRGNYKPWLAVAACAVVATGAVAWKHQQLRAEQNTLAHREEERLGLNATRHASIQKMMAAQVLLGSHLSFQGGE